MQERLEMRCQSAKTLSDMTAALQNAAIMHSLDLQIDHDRMLSDFGVLWMVIRMRLTLSRFPNGEFTVQTFLQKPGSIVSLRNYRLFDSDGDFGSAVQTWVLVRAEERSLLSVSKNPAMQAVPFVQTEHTDPLRKIKMPPAVPATLWRISPNEIDNNGHLNNIEYIRHAEALVPSGCTGLEIVFDRECFAGEVLRLETAHQDGYFVRGIKENGEESFSARFRKEDSL